MLPVFARIFVFLSLLSAALPLSAQDYDLVILNGRVIDPNSGLDAVRNIGIDGGSIAVITPEPISGAKRIDATGHVVSPGFIDLHAHGQGIGAYRMQAMQGVTTALELESGVLPIDAWYEIQSGKRLPIHYGASASWTFARIAAFSGTEPQPTVGYFQAAQAQSDWKERIATAGQLEEIFARIERGLDEGAIGIGINAGYAPGHGQKEYFALAELAARRGVATYTHVRYSSIIEPDAAFEAVKELIANAALTGARMHLCHINSSAVTDIDAILGLVETAQAKGIPVSAGAYPWGAGSTVVGAAMFRGPGWKERQGYRPGTFQLGHDRLSDEELLELQETAPGTIIIKHFLDESDPAQRAILDRSILHPGVLIESDAMPWFLVEGTRIELFNGDDWPLPDHALSHPRSSGSFAKILGSYVRDRGLLTLSQAIRKMSLMPAQWLESFVPQMKRKGRIQVGMDADIVVFDPAVIANRATYTESTVSAVGVQTLIVDGTLVIEQGGLILDAAPGKAIRRTPWSRANGL